MSSMLPLSHTVPGQTIAYPGVFFFLRKKHTELVSQPNPTNSTCRINSLLRKRLPKGQLPNLVNNGAITAVIILVTVKSKQLSPCYYQQRKATGIFLHANSIYSLHCIQKKTPSHLSQFHNNRLQKEYQFTFLLGPR